MPRLLPLSIGDRLDAFGYRRRLMLVLCVAAVVALSVAAAGVAGINTYCNDCTLNPATAITNYQYNYWNYNEMYPAESDMPTGIYMQETNGVKFGQVNGVGYINWSSGGTGYGTGVCWNRSTTTAYLVTDCFDRA